jgi:hypothetical protein
LNTQLTAGAPTSTTLSNWAVAAAEVRTSAAAAPAVS